MSKAEGKKVGVKFTQPLTSGTEAPIIENETQKGIWSASGSYSIYNPINFVKDANIGTYWESRTTSNYIQIYKQNIFLKGIKVYKGSSYRPTTYNIQTSIDGINFSPIKTGSFVAATGWETILLDNVVNTNYIRVSFGYSSRLYLYEFLLIENIYKGLILSGYEHLYADGPSHNGELVYREYDVVEIEEHPIEENSILLTVAEYNNFRNVKGQLTLTYTQALTPLAGLGGPVEDFIINFSPTDLIPQPNPRVREYIEANVGGTVELKLIMRVPAYAPEYIQASVGGTAQLIHIDDINP